MKEKYNTNNSDYWIDIADDICEDIKPSKTVKTNSSKTKSPVGSKFNRLLLLVA